MQTCRHNKKSSMTSDDFYVRQLLGLEPYAQKYLCSIIATVAHSENQEAAARTYYLALEMRDMLRKVIDPEDFISNKEIKALLNRIDGKE